jgi:predicted unusual protein kinase regulating ubiquinone biosynthesis (AarF/ABC1/UbiB family)
VRLPNIPQMVDTLMRVHGAQLMWDGVLNVDPHAGNFLLLQEPEPEPELEPAVASAAGSPGSPTRAAAAGRRDGSGRRKSAWGRGRIGLIDYGATHRLTREERLIAGLYTPLVYQRMHAHAN